MKSFSLKRVVILVTFFIFGIGNLTTANSGSVRRTANLQGVVAVQRVVVVTMKVKNGDNVVYEMTDSTRGDEQADGWIDFANFIKVFYAEDVIAGSRLARDTKYPITVKISYFHPGDKVSSSFSHMSSKEEWFGGFNAKIVNCIDANGRAVYPAGGKWETMTVSERFMQQLQQMYEKYH